jgi:uncharacterized protein (TIGR03790 family)
MRIPRVFAGALTAVFLCLFAPAALHAQSAENVAVVINDNSEDSRRVGEHYARTRSLPASNVLRIQTSNDEVIQRAEYAVNIERSISQAIRRSGLQDRLLYLVLTKGVPLRIAGSPGIGGTMSSVDSELTLLYRRMVGTPVPVDGRVDNPYFLGARAIKDAKPFSHREHDIYLVTRIDGFTADQAMAIIDRAQIPSREGRVVLDQLGSGGTGDQWMSQAAARLTELGHGPRVLLENTAQPARNEKAVLGYYSLGASDPTNQVRNLQMAFVPGSIAASLASFDARTFKQPPPNWRPTASADRSLWFEGSPDALIGDLIQSGVGGVAGQVSEAYPFGAVRPEILFPAYLAGFNLAEAFYLATPTLSWQTIVIGDPLCAPFSRTPLSRDQLEQPVDESTGYPGIFAARRSVVVLAANRDVPESAAPALMRAQALLDRDDKAGARRALEEVVKAAPRAAGALVGLAQLEEELGEYEAAVGRYRLVVEAQPNHTIALNNLAYGLAVRLKSPAEALPYAQRAAKLAPLSGGVLDTLAWIHHLLGSNEVAAKLLAEAVRLEPRQAEIRLHAALVFMAIADVPRAGRELDEALRLDRELEKRDDVQRLRLQLRR